MLYKLNEWYDNQKEPYRFLLFFSVFVPGAIMATYPYSYILQFFGWVWLGVMLYIRLFGRKAAQHRVQRTAVPQCKKCLDYHYPEEECGVI